MEHVAVFDGDTFALHAETLHAGYHSVQEVRYQSTCNTKSMHSPIITGAGGAQNFQTHCIQQMKEINYSGSSERFCTSKIEHYNLKNHFPWAFTHVTKSLTLEKDNFVSWENRPFCPYTRVRSIFYSSRIYGTFPNWKHFCTRRSDWLPKELTAGQKVLGLKGSFLGHFPSPKLL